MTTNANPYIVTPTVPHRGPYVDAVAIAKDLAAAWGAELGECEPGAYGTGRVVFGDLVVTIRADSRKLGRIEAYSGAPAITRVTGTLHGVEWPEASLDSGRGIAKIAADLKRRVVEPAAEPLAKAQAKLAALNADRENLERNAAALSGALPFLDISVPEDRTKWEAPVYASRNGVYLSGRLNSNGGLYLDRIPTIPADRVQAVLAALFGDA